MCEKLQFSYRWIRLQDFQGDFIGDLLSLLYGTIALAQIITDLPNASLGKGQLGAPDVPEDLAVHELGVGGGLELDAAGDGLAVMHFTGLPGAAVQDHLANDAVRA